MGVSPDLAGESGSPRAPGVVLRRHILMTGAVAGAPIVGSAVAQQPPPTGAEYQVDGGDSAKDI